MLSRSPNLNKTISKLIVPYQINYMNKSCLSHFNQNHLFPVKIKDLRFHQKRTITNTEPLIPGPAFQPQIYTGIFKTLSESYPVQCLQSSLIEIHSYTGLPWWGTIICSTILMRSLSTLPIAVYQKYIIAKLELLKYEMNDLVKELKRETSIAVKMYNWDEKTGRRMYNASLRKHWNRLIIRDNCHPLKTTLLMWVQIPLWVSISMSLRNLIYMLPKRDQAAEMYYTQLSTEGIGWIPNLTEIDPYFILPVTFGVINLALIELMVLSKVAVPTKFQKIVTNAFRGFTIILVPICAYVPSGILVYWTTSSIFGLVQNIILMSPKVKRFCRIPPTPSELENPYKELKVAIKDRFSFILKNK